MRTAIIVALLSLLKSVSGAADATPVAIPDRIRAVVDAPDRSAADKALDAGRHPAEMLTFFGVSPGMRVADLGAGGGYTTELLARTVGPSSGVYGQRKQIIFDRVARKSRNESRQTH